MELGLLPEESSQLLQLLGGWRGRGREREGRETRREGLRRGVRPGRWQREEFALSWTPGSAWRAEPRMDGRRENPIMRALRAIQAHPHQVLPVSQRRELRLQELLLEKSAKGDVLAWMVWSVVSQLLVLAFLSFFPDMLWYSGFGELLLGLLSRTSGGSSSNREIIQ